MHSGILDTVPLSDIFQIFSPSLWQKFHFLNYVLQSVQVCDEDQFPNFFFYGLCHFCPKKSSTNARSLGFSPVFLYTSLALVFRSTYGKKVKVHFVCLVTTVPFVEKTILFFEMTWHFGCKSAYRTCRAYFWILCSATLISRSISTPIITVLSAVPF